MAPKKLITSADRLKKYSKQTLIELVLELRERFADYRNQAQTVVAKREAQATELSKANNNLVDELNKQRKKNRELMKLVPKKDLQKFLAS